MSERDTQSGGPSKDPERLPQDETQRDPDRLLESGAESDPARLLPASVGGDRPHDAPDARGWYVPHHPAHHPRHTAKWLGALLGLVAAYAIGMAVHDRIQARDYNADMAARMTGGDPARGSALIRSYGCAQCHTIPGVRGASALVGPPLTGIASRVYIAGVATNTPDHMIRWVMNPKAIDPKTAMPYLGVTEDQARDIAAYLYTLR